MRKLHAPVWAGLQTALADIFLGRFPADKVIQRHLKQNPKWGSGDRRLFAEATYDLVRWWRRLLFASGYAWPTDDHVDGHHVEITTELLARVAAAWCALNQVDLAVNIARPRVDEAKLRAAWDDAGLPRATRESIPDWMDQRGAGELGERWPTYLTALNKTAPVYLRANRLRTDPAALRAELAREQIETELAGADGLRLVKRANVFLSSAFRRGLFEVQDLHSQRVAATLDPRPGERVIDACAGAGGKSLHLAALMTDRGRVIAMDVGDKKLAQLRLRAKRAGASCIEPRLIESTKVIKRLKDSADRVLLDVPCSGLGILRRNPDAKWRLGPADVERVTTLQQEILSGYAGMCKVGGTLVYSTCSILPSENERQVEVFLARRDGWRLEGSETLAPTDDGGDGFFIARLTRQS